MAEKVSPDTIQGGQVIRNIPFAVNMAELLVDELFKKCKNNPFLLANIRLILPTKRACLAVKEAFMRKSPHGTLLPQMTPIYEVKTLNADIPPAISQMERLLLLAKLCQAKPNISTYDQALKMAVSLTELLDISYQFELDLSHLSDLVALEQFAIHWQETVQFLDILHTHWPHILQERGQIDTMDYTIRQIRELTKEIEQHPEQIIFMAGFTDVFPAITDLIQVIEKNKNNLILKQIFPKNEQEQKQNITSPCPQEPIIVKALTQDSWQMENFDKTALQHVHLITAATTNEEALTIALLLRQVLETPQKTAALVTTDRTLARQVIAQMKRWDIQLDDSAGTPLNHTEIGLFLSLIADVGLHPTGTNYLSLLKHPLAADGQTPSKLRLAVQQQEKTLRQKQQRWEMVLNTDFSKWTALFQNNLLISFKEILIQHIELAEKLATSSDRTATERLWQNDVGKQMFTLLTELLQHADMVGQIESQNYPEVFKLFLQQQSTRPRYGMHPRLDILGPIEARFHHTDVCIIGGLNEGIFPPIPETGPWLNRPMRQQLNLPLPEAKIEELAVDFAHNFCSKEVYLTRTNKVEGALAVPSRFIERLKAVADINQLDFIEQQSNLCRLLDQPAQYDTPTRPAPCPPTEVRPTTLPVTQIEMWRRNPYGIYARYILKLYPLTPLEDASNKAEFGQLIHEAIYTFLNTCPTSTDKNLLLQIARKIFDESRLTDINKTLLNIKFSAIADFIIEQQKQDIARVKKCDPEQKISCTFNVNNTPFTLYGKADRIDTLKDGTIRIIDYKNYTPPSKKEVLAGFAPQLVLEALLLDETQSRPISTLTYWHLNNKKDGSNVVEISTETTEVKEAVTQAKAGLLTMVQTFQNPCVPYEVCPIASQAPTYNDYAHLARMQEWAATEEEE